MRPNYTANDLRTLRLLHEYGFTDAELADHLGLSPVVVRHLRGKLSLAPNGAVHAGLSDRRSVHRIPTQGGAGRSHIGVGSMDVGLKSVDDRFCIEA